MERIQFPETVGQGTIERIRLHSGMEIHIWDFQLREADDVEITSPVSFIDLNFLLHGHIEYCIDGVSQHAIENFSQLSFRNEAKKIKYIAGVSPLVCGNVYIATAEQLLFDELK
ncbi:hypothetical protein [Paenibacillus tyrfis]|uniref:hypothetical protein n=1 Tax=Paenibacillus tyrfis TaxID=1501230 RepID=UPI000B591C3F|nr:hypothetical protein [Paenibacillus tyrfis]